MTPSEKGRKGAAARWQNRNDEERFWSKVDRRSKDECWPWTATAARYGMFRWRGKNRLAHRIAYYFAYGVFPTNVCVCHRCDNTKCCNPNHLWLGSRKDNAQDALKKGRLKWPKQDNWKRNFVGRLYSDEY
ncbi:MAG TPA: HNH endonuclease signature motif containing protein, partial [Nitrospiraceae bacterium]|nr:HNH endonuclease signature motif containing protein [Nitrospiraceae bacterium]